MAITREELRNRLRRREIAPVYVLYGPETYQRDIAAKTIANLAFDEGDYRDFNEDEFSLNIPDNLTAALSAAEQLPMMAAHRVVRVVDVRVAASAAKDTLKEANEQVLSEYLKNPAGTSVVIFIADELNGTRKISKLLTANSVAVEFIRLSDFELVEWARTKIAEVGSEADDRTVRHLVAVVGDDLRRFITEIEKLSTAALPDTRITIDLIDSIVPNMRELTNFALTDHLNAGRTERSLEAMKKILDDGTEPLMVLGLLGGNYRRMLVAKELIERGASPGEVERASKAYGPGKSDFLAAARRTDASKLNHILDRIAKTDLAIKTSIGGGGPQGSRMQIEMLVCELAFL